ncbi:alpha/beta hydrolase [Embleya sp. NBC_00896]|uniref:alpha/beta fold hydrolase n=1 Tax=Embleya sp. NBC_00896 TaxID=2975961 RepID=UPI002F91477F|nr:alpha/beta hydrolase [Embleya sp. NBC_00896]
MPFIRSGSPDTQLFYEDFGAGPPIVLLHGWPLSGRFWEGQVRALVEAGHRVVCPDRRGFGRSAQPWEGYDYDTFAADLTALLLALNLEDAVLVGHSTGCGDVVRCAASGAVRPRAVVLADPVLRLDPDTDPTVADDLTDAGLGYRIAMLDDVLRRLFSADGRPSLDQATHRYLLGLAAAASPKGGIDAITAWAHSRFTRDLTHLKPPTLIVHGASDAFAPFESGPVQIAALIPHVVRVEIPHAPHAAPFTHAEQWTRILLDFLA